ncbi:MAG: hypothetical protein RLZZ15_3712, partial [Verrucomicrobiota bacterium]
MICRSLVSAFVLLAVTASAQTLAPATPPPDAAKKTPTTAALTTAGATDPLVLSPFEVVSEETGYYTQRGLSSGRLGVDLKDSAANVNVFTKELAADLGAIDLGNLLEFSNSTQLDQADFTGSTIDPVVGEGAGRANISGRARGLPTIRLVDYEVADWEIDNYNVDRTDIFLGTDAILFGNGSSGGTINSSRDSANFRRNRTIISYNLGSNGRNRAVFDSNTVLIPKKLALRVGLVKYHTDGRRMWDYADRKAGSLAATFQATKTTTFRASFDTGNNHRHQPMINNLPENRASQWLNSKDANKTV